MSRSSLFNSPMLVGFDALEELLDRMSRSSNDGYPPYNIEQISDRQLRITLAVAGFAEDDLAVTVEDNQLVVRGKQGEDGERHFLHRGIAARQFQKSFVLADDLEVAGAQLANGLLHVDLERNMIDAKVRQIAITTTDDGTED